MDSEKKLTEQLAEFQAQADVDKSVDVAGLMAKAMDGAVQVAIDKKKYHRAYWISILIPPFGLFYAIYYLFSGKLGSKKVALYCVILTIISFAITALASQLLFSSIDSSTDSQLQQLKAMNVEDVRSLFQ